MSKHTPGPWMKFESSGMWDIISSRDPQLLPGVNSWSFSLLEDLTESDADLIAAAPEMLDKLKIVLGYGLGPEMRKAIENTIAKAEGR